MKSCREFPAGEKRICSRTNQGLTITHGAASLLVTSQLPPRSPRRGPHPAAEKRGRRDGLRTPPTCGGSSVASHPRHVPRGPDLPGRRPTRWEETGRTRVAASAQRRPGIDPSAGDVRNSRSLPALRREPGAAPQTAPPPPRGHCSESPKPWFSQRNTWAAALPVVRSKRAAGEAGTSRLTVLVNT